MISQFNNNNVTELVYAALMHLTHTHTHTHTHIYMGGTALRVAITAGEHQIRKPRQRSVIGCQRTLLRLF
jgi:hypothetical protein